MTQIAVPPSLAISRQHQILGVLAALVIAASIFGIGIDGLLLFGPLVAFGLAGDVRASVSRSSRNLTVGAASAIAFLWFWLTQPDVAQAESATPSLIALGGLAIVLPLGLQSGPTRPDAKTIVNTRSLILSIWGLVVFTYLYYAYGQGLNLLMGLCLVLPIALVVSRFRLARHGEIEMGLLRQPFQAAVRPHRWQLANIWLFCLSLGGVLLAGGEDVARTEFPLSGAQFDLLSGAFLVGVVVLAALALIPRRQVHLPTNIAALLLSGFFALQLVRISTPPDNPTTLDSPLSGGWFVSNSGRSVLLNGHSPNESNSLDFRKLGRNGLTHAGDSSAPLTDYFGFNQPVVAPIDGTVVEVTDSFPDTPPGTNGEQANHLVIDIGDGLFVAMAHFKQDSIAVEVGDLVETGDFIGSVGNSGHTDAPHLHLQVQDSPAGTDAERTYPIVFRNVDVTRGGYWPWGVDGELRTGDSVR